MKLICLAIALSSRVFVFLTLRLTAYHVYQLERQLTLLFTPTPPELDPIQRFGLVRSAHVIKVEPLKST